MENINFKKKFGQNFIYDTNLLRAIVTNDAKIDENDEVLEIGVGAGTLTKEICKNAKKVVSYEIDTDLKNVIENTLLGVENSKIIYKDFMEESVEDLTNNFDNKFKVVANLPYYITTPIIFKLLEIEKTKSITIMVQKEVAERICAKENTDDYGILTIMINSMANSTIKRIVKRNMFTPMPNVDSAVVNIEIDVNKFKIADLKLFKKVVNSAFNHRRKMLISNLRGDLCLDKTKLEEVFNDLGIDQKVRGEALNIQKFVELTNKIADIRR